MLIYKYPISLQNAVKHNLWDKLDECAQSNDSKEQLGHQALDSEQCYLTVNYAEDRNIIEDYTMDTSLENCSINEKLLESLQSFDEMNGNHEIMVVDQNEGDAWENAAIAAKQRSEQFYSPVKSHQCIEMSTSAGFKKLGAQTPPSKTAMNTSVDSLVDSVELDSLLDGVEWSPMISSPENQNITR